MRPSWGLGALMKTLALMKQLPTLPTAPSSPQHIIKRGGRVFHGISAIANQCIKTS